MVTYGEVMSENLDNFTRAVAVFRSVGDRVPDGAWDNQSCCSDWTARQVAGHASWVLQSIAATAGGTPGPERQPEAEVAGDDPAATINSSCDAALAALDAADLSQVVPSPFGEMPIGTFVGVIWVDTLAHAWDIADATGIEHGIEPDLGTLAHQTTEPIADALRDFGGFAAALEEPADDPVGGFIAFTGRATVRA